MKLNLIIYKKMLLWQSFSQTKQDYCSIAVLQEIIYNLTNTIVNQTKLAIMSNYNNGVTPENSLKTLNNIFNQQKYNNRHFFLSYLQQNFAYKPNNKIITDISYFQNFVLESLKNNNFILLGLDGYIPWLNPIPKSPHDVNIIGIQIVNDDVRNTIYTVSETSSSDKKTFTGAHLATMFINGKGSLITLLNLNSQRVNSSTNFEFIIENIENEIDNILKNYLIEIKEKKSIEEKIQVEINLDFELNYCWEKYSKIINTNLTIVWTREKINNELDIISNFFATIIAQKLNEIKIQDLQYIFLNEFEIDLDKLSIYENNQEIEQNNPGPSSGIRYTNNFDDIRSYLLAQQLEENSSSSENEEPPIKKPKLGNV